MRKKFLLFLGSIVIFAIMLPVFSFSISTLGVNERSSKFKISASTELNDIVIIDDLPGSMTSWAWAKAQGYCTGNGTMDDRYIISDFFFNTSTYYYNCLTIVNSRKYFIIEDCLFKGVSGYAGVELDNTTNGVIQLNELYPLTGELVWIHNSSLNEISRNNASAASYYGILVDGLSKNNSVHSNIIRDNILFGVGINSEYNRIYQNCFINNGLHAIDDGANNSWDYLEQGNYWDNYTGADNDQNGIGDIPYNITGLARSKDNYPLMNCPLFISDEAIPGYNLLIMYLTGITMIIGVIYLKLKKKINVKYGEFLQILF
ncbi:MAG: NosD domain-containing protein [Promethearchaeota archaeon]